MKKFTAKKKGIVLLLTFIIMVTLAAITVGFLYMTSIQTKGSGYDIQGSGAFWLAEGGTQFGCWAVKEDREATDGSNTNSPQNNGYCRISYSDGGFDDSLESFPILGGNRVRNPDRVVLHGSAWNDPSPSFAVIRPRANSFIALWNFQQRINLIGGRLLSARIVIKARKNSGGGTNPEIRLQFSTDAGTTWYPDPANGDPIEGYEFTIDNNSWPTQVADYRFSPNLPNANWQEMMSNNGNDFRIRVLRLNAGNRRIRVDWLALEVVTEVDAATEPWGSGSYVSFPLSLGSGTIESITVSDESSKVHLNYASQALLRRLMREFSIKRAARKATAIINYRSSVGWFNTIEEVQQISNPTTLDDGDFEALRDSITVYSWVNNQVTLPTGARAPVNINTASANVLRAIIRCSIGKNKANQLVNAIITQRQITPFASMYSSYESQQIDGQYDLECFSGFIQSLDYRWLRRNEYERARKILNIADGSSFNINQTENWFDNDDAGGTEFCYYTNTFLITAQGQDGVIQRTVMTTYGEDYDYTNFSPNQQGTFALPTFIGETAHQYWREVGGE